MRLRDLDARFIRYGVRVETWTRCLGDPQAWKPGDPTEEVTGPRQYTFPVDTLAEAQGIKFQCPECELPHELEVTFAGRGVTDEQGCHNLEGKPTRWDVTGSGIDDLTTHPSILVQGGVGCNWHGFITNGDAK